ncbi:protein artemis isoform X1 [Pangasianodon hypophthalmus]|uniref:protein artemis isoform X1 n=1 Tax=Pangasianodon hypophthalmus TaxID=310915 RepID=UPI000EFED395|nr:protein artemis isoform X1 [Pangasianodon hypophthalmus]
MSSFPGRMKEYPNISIDRFDRENIHARAYFLSHCHKDHMKGLKGPLLKRKLKFSLTVKLYCSFVTKELLLNNPKYSFWEDRIVALELDSPTHISLTDELTGEVEDVVVTLLPAGHCPGSVMFLFEGAQGTVLYTGDFRLAAGDAARMEHLHSGNRVKDIQSVYLDSTFYDPRFYQIPSREACLTGIRKLVQDWICLSPYHIVWLNCKAAYGYEYLFTNLGQEFNSQVHVNRLNMFRQMPEILDHVTTNRATQIHACRHPKDDELFRTNRLPCGSLAPDGTPLRIISIKPSTMWFGERTRKTNVIVKMGGSSYRACFSFHSSYSEIKDFLSYISPVNIYPNVVPMGRTVEEVTELLNLMCRKHSGRAEVVYKPLGKLKRARIKSTSQGTDSEDELFAEVAVAPMRKKLAVNEEKEHHSPEKSDPEVIETQILPQLQPSFQTSNYMDCTESNDDDDDGDEDDVEEEERPACQSSGDATPTPSCLGMSPPPPKPAPPSWSTFFTAEPVVTDDSCELENSQNSQTLSTDHTTSQSPELFNDDDESESGHVTSSQSTYVSEAALESLSQLDTVPVQCNPMHTGNGFNWPDDAQPALTDSHQDQCDVTDQTEPVSDSQVSSDFDLPMTPGSKAPQPEELKELYRKLAAGEDVTTKNHQQGSV